MINIEKYIEKYKDRWTEGEADYIRRRHKELGDRLKFVHEHEMANECVVIYKGIEVSYSAVLRPCLCKECNCSCPAECGWNGHWCGNCRATCQ
jgi:hypothetical protein